jgi:hypothetical protein
VLAVVLTRRPPSAFVEHELDEVVSVATRQGITVADLWVYVDGRDVVAALHSLDQNDLRRVPLAGLPVVMGRHRLESLGDRDGRHQLRVSDAGCTDAELMAGVPCAPLISSKFRGIRIVAPGSVSVQALLPRPAPTPAGDGYVDPVTLQVRLPLFGQFMFAGEALDKRFDREDIEMVIESDGRELGRFTLHQHERAVSNRDDRLRGISRVWAETPRPEFPGKPTGVWGGPFGVDLSLHLEAVPGKQYEVWARCGPYSSNRVRVAFVQ